MKPNRSSRGRRELKFDKSLLPLIDAVIYHNFRWAVPKLRSGFCDIDDLRQEGALGILSAIELYNPRKGSLEAYAWWHIRARIGRFLRRNRFPNITVSSLTRTRLSFLPIDAPIRPHEPFSAGDLISLQAHRQRNSDNQRLASGRALIALVLKQLPTRDRQLILRRFGICACHKSAPAHRHEPMTLRQIGRELGVSRESVRQRLMSILATVRRSTEKAVLVANHE